MRDEATRRFELLYRQHFRAVLRYALARVEPETARDVTAETFLIAWRRLADVPTDAAPWLYGVARKVIAGQLRSATRRQALRLQLEAAGTGQPSGGDIGDEVADRAAVLTALARLREDDREALRPIAWDGLTSKAAAEVLGLTRVAFGVRLYRARRRFAAALETAERPPRAGPPAWPGDLEAAPPSWRPEPFTPAKETH